MNEIVWDIKEVKRLKTKSLVELNISMLLIFLFAVFYIHMRWSMSLFFGIACLIIWFFAALSLYTLISGKTTGTKTNKRVQAFDRQRAGDKRWKRRRIAEVIIFSTLGIVCTILVFPIDLSDESLQYINVWPFVGAWFGANLGSIFRIINLE